MKVLRVSYNMVQPNKRFWLLYAAFFLGVLLIAAY